MLPKKKHKAICSSERSPKTKCDCTKPPDFTPPHCLSICMGSFFAFSRVRLRGFGSESFIAAKFEVRNFENSSALMIRRCRDVTRSELCLDQAKAERNRADASAARMAKLISVASGNQQGKMNWMATHNRLCDNLMIFRNPIETLLGGWSNRSAIKWISHRYVLKLREGFEFTAVCLRSSDSGAGSAIGCESYV